MREEILAWCGHEDFTFFFIDPTGWKHVVEIPTLMPLLQRPNSEFLINFMYDFLLRTCPQEAFRADMQAIFGEAVSIGGVASRDREAFLIGRYQEHLKKIPPSRGGRPRVVHVPVLYPLRDRTLYHLVYLTRHPMGIVKFMEESDRLDMVQRRVRARAKQDDRERRSRQIELFPAAQNVGEKEVDLDAVKDYWLRILSTDPQRFEIEKLADMLEDTCWFESDFQAAFGELARAGKVKNLDGTGKRRKKFIHFDVGMGAGERLLKVGS